MDLEEYKQQGIQREPRFQSKEYLAWQHTQPCSVPDCPHPIESNHTVKRSRGNAASDVLTLPLCTAHHEEWHKSERAFSERYRLNMSVLIVRQFERFLSDHGLATPYKTEHKKVNRGTATPKRSKRKNRVPFERYEIPWLKL